MWEVLNMEVEAGTYSVRDLVDTVFNSAAPFMLWGLISELHTDFARVLAVDIISGHKLTFEISLEEIKIIADLGVPIISLRFFKLFQQHYGSKY